MGNRLPTLIEPESLDILIKEPDFDKKNRILEVHFGTNTKSEYEAYSYKKKISKSLQIFILDLILKMPSFLILILVLNLQNFFLEIGLNQKSWPNI